LILVVHCPRTLRHHACNAKVWSNGKRVNESHLLRGILLASAIAGCGTSTATPAVHDLPPSAAADQLAQIPVKGRAPMTGYDRDQFGPSWKDINRNGCDTRNDILARDLTSPKYSGRCKIMRGQLTDPYTGRVITFQRGQDTSSAVQIDHVVALGNAWATGAQQLSKPQREQLANDPLNLLAVDGPTNSAKGDRDAATWLPPRKAGRCTYITRQIAVKNTYRLWVTPAEKQAMTRELNRCT
jgi:hypothetical protein